MSQPGSEHQQRYFRSLDELQQTPEFEQFLGREFPQAASEFPEGVSRRRWLQMMSASLALGGVAGCRYNREEVAAFVVRPETRIPGVPEYFATNFEWAGRSVHGLVMSLEGRPLKVDGNAEHPAYAKSQPSDYTPNPKLASAGSDVFTQASILSLYDQDRIGHVLKRSKPGAAPEKFDLDATKNTAKSWDEFAKFVIESRKELDESKGKGLAILFEPTRSPSLRRVLAEIKAKYPESKLVRYESVYSGNVSKAIDAVGAGHSSLVYDLDQAKVIVSLDADLFGADANAVHYARQFANHRSPPETSMNGRWMNRLYAVEAQYSVTGASADFRLAIQSSQIAVLLAKIEAAIDAGTVVEDKHEDAAYNTLKNADKVQRAVEAIASDLLTNKGSSVLAVGTHHSVAVQVAALRINAKLGNIGKTVQLIDVPNELNGVETVKLSDFVANSSEYNTLWILPPNPLFTVAGDLPLVDAVRKIKNTVYLSNYDDETSDEIAWTVPSTHPLESWSDVRAADGVYGVGQPLIAPLLGGRSPLETLSALAGLPQTDGEKIVRDTADSIVGTKLSDRKWKEALHAGFFAGTQGKPFAGEIKADSKSLEAGGLKTESYSLPSGDVRIELDPDKLEVVILPSDTIYDGRLGNNGWLQECPQPITKLTWDNAAICSIGTARTLGLKNGELVSLAQGDARVKLPVYVVPGHAEGSFTVNLGYGRSKKKGGIIAGAVGTNLASFRRWNQAAIYTGIVAKGTSEVYRLATTQDHFAIEDEGGMRENAKRAPQLVREGTLEEFQENASFTTQIVEHHFQSKSIWEEPPVNVNHKWGMTIDLNKCTGCNACVIACQAENNVPIVGKEQVIRGREMHWLRIDRYFQCDFDKTYETGTFKDPIDPVVVTQPMACAHCETAPCEEVCPVAATVHTEEGINAMAYNRCIGTRYCANNCPYKVRRFNYFNFNTEYGYYYGWQDLREKASQKLQSMVLNPEVTVRGRGVMEKCTYCIQRVQNAKIKANNRVADVSDPTKRTELSRVQDGEVISACQQACPTQAIVFGDLNDKTSRVLQSQNDPRSYAVLEELNIRPRTLYLSRIRNVPKRLMTASQQHPKRFDDSHHAQAH